jgi:malate dehydrogenase
VSPKEVTTLVLGGHGDTMVPCLSYCTVNGIPVRQLLAEDVLSAIVKRTAGGGGEIVKLMGTSAYYAPAAGALAIAEAYLKDQKRLLACAAYLEGEYGYSDYYMGVPVIIGGGGVEGVVSITLSADEKAALDKSFEAVREVTEASLKL